MTDDGVIRWESPPDKRAQMAYRWQAVADELRKRPHEWAVLLEGNSSQCSGLVQYIKAGLGPFEPRGSFESCSRSIPHGARQQQATFARYVGGES